MKKQPLYSKLYLLPGLLMLLAIIMMAFQDSTKPVEKKMDSSIDTLPKNRDIDIDLKMNDLEKTIQQSMETVNRSLNEINWSKISSEVTESLKKIDFEKIRLDIDKSLKSIDWDKMKMDIDNSVKSIDKEKIKADIDMAIKEARKDINVVEIKKELDNVKKELEINKDKLKLEMNKAKEEIRKEKNDLIDIKEMTSEMEKDGLIDKKSGYQIEYKNNQLLINGKRQSNAVIEKYRKYNKGDNFKIKYNKQN